MKIAIVAPSPVPFVYGGAENIYAGLLTELNRTGVHQAELIKLPAPENSFWAVIDSYYRFAALDLDHFDAVLSLKYPAWMVSHRHHVVYMQHKLRGLYDTYVRAGQPTVPQTDHARVRRLCAFLDDVARLPVERTEALVYLRALLGALRDDPSVPPDVFAFPGPLIRKLVRCLDALALRDVQIRSYNAISRTVADRPGYFPRGAEVRVIYHPSGLPGCVPGAQRFFFTASRLDASKRIDLLIDAYRRAATDLPLLIAGDGPEAAVLRARAAEDARIRFLGYLDSTALAAHYADAAAVLFVPQDEDFGLVALEAMRCGKPVITATDSGGCAEIIAHGRTGFVVDPEPGALAARIDAVAADPAQAAAIGMAARASVEGITWSNLIRQLFPDAPARPCGLAAPAIGRGARPLITVLSTFPASRPRGGGPLRIFNLHDRLRRHGNVELLVFDSQGRAGARRELAPGLAETVLTGGPAYRAAEAALSEAADWVPVGDSAFPLIHRHAPDFIDLARRSARASDAVVLEHPFLLPALDSPGVAPPLILDAHNVEIALKHRIYPDTRGGRALLGAVLAVEREACAASREIWHCAPEDARLLTAWYRVPPERLVHVPNGVDTRRVPFVPPSRRARRRAQYAIRDTGRLMAYFIGSWHGPNIEAARAILDCARHLPDTDFVLAGGAGEALRRMRVDLPRNVALVGVIDDDANEAMLTSCDLALNPMTAGSGSNLKLFEYCAAGAPVVTTALGARGSGLRHGAHLWQASIEQFVEAIVAARAEPPERADRRAVRARGHVEAHFDWDVIVNDLLADSHALRALLPVQAAKSGGV